MAYATADDRYVPGSAWFKLSDVTLRAVLAITLATVAASLFLASSGMHEISVLPMLLAAGAVALGFAIVKLFHHFEVEGLPLIE